MFQTFESHAHQWVDRYTIAVNQYCEKSFAETPSNQSALENYIRITSSQDIPPITPSQLTSNSNLKTNSDNLNEDEGVVEGSGMRSYEVDPKLTKPIVLGSNKLIPISPAYIDNDKDFERQDPSNVYHQFSSIDKTYISLSGNLYQLREVIDYWLPLSKISEGRIKWLPSKLIEEIRIRTINELNFIQNCFTERLQILNNSLCKLREGSFGGRLNTKSLTNVQIWERVTFSLLLKVLGLPALNAGLQHDFPGYDAELN
ncbi:uncharacterized protein MELLADRAFT_103121 [Melampsora larici-populina 98AG31]|uniref:Uncharacterized protein n=1 Tax=Melampsora larici-populina (strain 98AG31 / pathotype 3-4-7) TaxID=747676 RepID=F4RAM0_MELLP|nr:uncharacterized protein MELLADRAFT_103121 [Melampsora larici-populina 98AG31]EGG10504.1 hypothetical protein MELLADRAFT_103121 [Melampsora larici-populina 98AG31]